MSTTRKNSAAAVRLSPTEIYRIRGDLSERARTKLEEARSRIGEVLSGDDAPTTDDEQRGKVARIQARRPRTFADLARRVYGPPTGTSELITASRRGA